MDIKRTVLWVVFSLSVVLLWDNWMRYNGKPSMFFPNPVSQQAGPAAAGSAGSTPVPSAGSLPAAATVAGAPAINADGAAAPAPVKSETITITTDIVKADIDTAGGELKRLELFKFRDVTDPTANMLLFESDAAHTYLAETGLIGGPFPNHKTIFTALPGPRTLDNGKSVQLVLEAEQGGLKLTKTFTFKRGDYVIDVKHTVTNTGTVPVSPSLYMQLIHDGSKPAGESKFYSTFTGPAVYTEADHFQKVTFDKIEKLSKEKDAKPDHAVKADNGWVAMVQHYFVSAFIPTDKAEREIRTEKVRDNLYAVSNVLPLGVIAPGATVTSDARLYSGPQESAVMEQTTPGLELVKDYGWLTIIAKPIFWLMLQIHKVVDNWGWTIIFLTVFIKLLFFPLSAASYRSMAKMKLVTPKMTAIRERHKGDPQKMNQAMMELYKTEKINPLGGCLPIVIQIPVFISLYWVLLASVEMRDAPWLGWIHNLSAPDPFYILPVIMAISMFIQTKLNPTPADPVQAKVMMFMPLVFSAMFFFFPSGLVLYWVVNNVLSIAQQWVITKKMEQPKAVI
jgi:YidC/Oxa1 family membrane protein insertase